MGAQKKQQIHQVVRKGIFNEVGEGGKKAFKPEEGARQVFYMRKHLLVAGGSAAIPCHSALLPRGGGLGLLQPRAPWGATGWGRDPA